MFIFKVVETAVPTVWTYCLNMLELMVTGTNSNNVHLQSTLIRKYLSDRNLSKKEKKSMTMPLVHAQKFVSQIMHTSCWITKLLRMVVGDENTYCCYIFKLLSKLSYYHENNGEKMPWATCKPKCLTSHTL